MTESPTPPPATASRSTSMMRSATISLVTLAGGAALAAIPAATIAIAARLFPTQQQGWIAVAVLVATFAGQLVAAAVVESRLGSAETDRRVTVPRWLAIAGVAASVLVAIIPANAVMLIIGLPVMLAALEVGRQVAIAERLDRREFGASVLVGLGALGGVAAAIVHLDWALAPLALGIAGATVLRALPVAHAPSAPHPIVRRWIVADTALTGAVIPLLNTVILGLLGANDAILFTAVSTASGVLAIPLNFMRARLLKEHSRLDIVASAIAVCGGFAVLVTLHFTGVLGAFFGPVWTVQSATAALLVACAWRAASLATSVPFAALRRLGRARLVAVLRAGVSALTFALAVGGLAVGAASGLVGGLVGAFAGLLAAELLSAVAYEVARRRATMSR